jgi:hypothetical protein
MPLKAIVRTKETGEWGASSGWSFHVAAHWRLDLDPAFSRES